MMDHNPAQQDLSETPRPHQFSLPTHATPTAPLPPQALSGFSPNTRLPTFAASSARLAKHPLHLTMPAKRVGVDEANGVPAKHPKKDDPEDFSNAVKKRLQSSSRTGQACDRCKIRKIRCDALPGGCSPCLQSNTECCTTDRTTGATHARGRFEQLEEQNRTLHHRIRELEQRLIQGGGDIRPSNGYHDASAPGYEFQGASNVPATAWSPNIANSIFLASQDTNRTLPTFRAGCNGDNYLGVSTGNSNLSSIKGTALSILGMEIDIADFVSMDMDEPDPALLHAQLYNKSYQAFLQTALNVNPRLAKVELPLRQEGLTYAQWYFRALNPYLPILHRPTFFQLLTRMYDDETFRPTAAETVIVHIVFAIMFFQYAVRNWEDADQQKVLNDRSNMHYHYALSFFYQLSVSHQLQDVQAMTLICAHLRNFSKPGASWMLIQLTMSLAVELGLHRSVQRWSSDIRPNPLDVEIRKRTFYSLLALHVGTSGRLGRPMFLKYEDFDVELPDAVDDELLTEHGLDTSAPGKCLHELGLAAFRIMPLYMEMYSSIYAVRRDENDYLSTVNRLEAKLTAWKESLPAELVRGNAGESEHEGRVFALYAQVWPLEFRLLLRHPSVAATGDSGFNAESMRVCVESSRQILGVVRQMQKFKSLDTTWGQASVYVLAITTTLFAQWDKRNETSTADLAALKEEMNIWLEIMGDVGAFLGSGTRLREAIQVVTDGTLGLLSRSIPSKIPYKITLESTKTHRPARTQSTSAPHQNYSADTASSASATATYIQEPPQHQQTPYPAAYNTYPDPNLSQNLAYNPSASYQTYPPTPQKFEQNEKIEAPLLAAFAAQASQLPPSTHNTNQYQQPSASSSWQQYTNAMVGNIELQDCYSASALMQLQGGRETGDPSQHSDVTATAGLEGLHVGVQGSGTIEGQWPLLMFNVGQGS